MKCEYGRNSSKRMSIVTRATAMCCRSVIGAVDCWGRVEGRPGNLGGSANAVGFVAFEFDVFADSFSTTRIDFLSEKTMWMRRNVFEKHPRVPAASRCGQSGGSHTVSSAMDMYGNIPMLNIWVVIK